MAEAPSTVNRFGSYIVLEKLGGGGMAVVYRARHEETGAIVALKILRASLMEQPGIVERFKQEAVIATRLRHPHIVPVNNYGAIKGRYYLEMDYLSGGTLAERFRQPRAIGTLEVIRLLRDVAGALDYAHNQGVIHRDLKLENILLSDKGSASLTDFSIARLSDGNRLTATGFVVGTPMTIAPEQARGDANLDHRADLYSFAVIAYVLAVGRYPFNADNPLSVMHQHMMQPVPVPSTINRLLPQALDQVLIKGLAKQPSERYPTGDMFVEAFARALGDLPNTQTVVDLRTDTLGNVVKVPTPPPADKADDWYAKATQANDPDEAIRYLKRALEIEPLHSKANRMLFQLEGATPKGAPPRPTAVELSPLDLADLKKANYASQKRSNWYYVVLIAVVLTVISGVYFALSLSGSPIATDIANLLQGKRPVTEINGVPIAEVQNAVLLVEPQERRTATYGTTIRDNIGHGFSYAYSFNAEAGQRVAIGVWFSAQGAQNASAQVAVVDPQGQLAGNRCERLTPDSATVQFNCQIDQSGLWTMRMLGVDGQTAGDFIFNIERVQ